MRKQIKCLALATVCALFGASGAFATTAPVPSDGVYNFTFGVSETQDGSIPVPATAVCDVNGTYTDTFSYGFLGTTDTSYLDDVPSNLPSVPHAIDGFNVVKGQKIVLHDGTDSSGKSIVYGPAASEYLPEGASEREGRYPVRFAARMPERGYYAVSCTVANASSTANADVTLFSERCHTHAQHLTLAPGETKTFSWSVELAPNFFKASGTYNDNAINVVVVGENAALASVTVTKQPTTTENATINGAAQERINVGKTMWLCDDSTGTDQRCDTPYFALQNYSGVGSGLSRWAPENLSIRNQGEGGLASAENAHFNTCLLKPGDYLYVEYGHNESSTENFTSNLEKYLTRATEAGGYLIIVSPIERRYTWDSTNNKWSRTLQAFATAGKAWVEDKIANGATNVAFLDLNEYYSTWMNQEIVRINGVNSSVSLKDAISYYYMSSKGGSVDTAHPNNAGADWGAYWVWKAAVDVVAVGESAEEGSSAKIQANVVRGIIDGVADRISRDTPWLVSDEIIAAGKAPNSYWDKTIRAGYDYIKSAAVASVDATVSEGVVTIRGVSMRVMNQLNYTKAVIDIVSADSSTTNRWYSFYNYDASGNTPGDIVVPEAAGFIDEDLDKDASSDGHYSETLTVPAGGKAYVWFSEASGNTWQVGDKADAPLSAKYPVEAWTGVLVDDDCSYTSTWTSLFGGVHTFESASDPAYISFSCTGWDDAGTRKKNGGFAKKFADSATVSEGRLRISFKTSYTQGVLVFVLSDTEGSAGWPLEGGDVIATLDGSAAVFEKAANVTLSADATPVAQSTVNSDEWMDVDMIVDIDAGKVFASIGGSDYTAFPFGTLVKTPWKYFGVTLKSEKAHAGAIDDVKIVTLAPSPKHLVEAAANNAAYGHVEINGAAATSLNAVEGMDIALSAVSADPDLYKFVHWEDASGNTVSKSQTFVIEDLAADCSYKAIFDEYAEDEDCVITWDFAGYKGDFAVAPTAATTVTDNGMTFSLQGGDSMTANGLVWQNSALGHKSWSTAESLSETEDHYIIFAPSFSGVFTLKFSIDNYNSSRTPQMFIMAAESFSECTKTPGDAAVSVLANAADKEFTLSADLEAGKTYYIWTYSNNWVGGQYYHNYTISSITYTYTPVFDATFDVGEGDTDVKIGIPSKTANVTKTGDGMLVLLGNNAFSGSLLVGAGTLKLGSPSDIPGMIYDFDASADEAIVCDGESVTGIKDRLGLCENLYPQGVAGAVSSINGKPAVLITERYRTVESMRAGATFFACKYLDSAKSWNALMKQVVDKEENSNNYSITEYNDGVLQRRWSNGSSAAGSSGRRGTENLYKNGGTSTAIDANPMVFTVNMAWQNGSSAVWYGPHKSFAIGEILAYSSPLSTAERVAVEEYLMAKWGIGNVAYAPIPASAGVEIATGATLDLGGMTQTVASLSVAAGGVVTNGTLVVASEPAIASGAYAAATDNGDGTWNVVWADVATVVDTHSFVWNWNVKEGDWNDPANWLYEGKVQATTYPCDAESDYATFTTPATVTLTGDSAVKEAWFNANVTLTGGTLTTTLAATYDNSGKVTLSNAGFANLKNLAATISCPIVMAADTVNWFNKVADGDWKEYMTVSGNISGSGRYNVNIANVQGNAIHFTGNNNEFYGDVYTSGGKSNRSVISWGDDSVGTNTFLHIGHSYGNYNSDSYRMGSNVKFGGVDGDWWDRYDGAQLTIGYLNRDSTINIYNGVDGRANSVKKVGSAKLTLGTTTIKDLTIEAGSVTMPAGIAPNTLTIATDTMIYIPASAEWTAGNTYDLFSYTTLKGAGELARQVSVTGLAAGLEAEISVVGTTVKAAIKSSTPEIDPAAGVATVAGDGTEAPDAIAATVALAVPDAIADLEGYDAAAYQANFTKTAVYYAENGVWTVTATIAEDKVAAVEDSVVAALVSPEDATVAVPLGLYYRFTAMDELGTPNPKGVKTGLSDGYAVEVVKPTDTAKGFVKVELGATSFE